ncbi:MAG: hypothetical protein AAFR57_14490, partial [Pseudomonadota bacterium]
GLACVDRTSCSANPVSAAHPAQTPLSVKVPMAVEAPLNSPLNCLNATVTADADQLADGIDGA